MRILAVVLSTGLFVTACGSTASTACEGPDFEELDPQSIVHVITDDGVTYLTDPPTSGPHASGAIPDGDLDQALSPSLQVAVLERGDIIVQFQPDVVSAEQRSSISGDGVVTFANSDLDAALIATAWQHRLTCTEFDRDAIVAFRSDHGGFSDAHN